MNITKDISPLTEFKRDSARMIARIKETGRPQILTVNGKPGLTQARAGEGTEAGQFFDGLAQTK
ncbi:MAG: hypothetical protein CVT80_06290 [Alphaproteobacteria bacterium HGW-Alphaproteobacteria-2]|nr:MAG: hypothetical protein CVT80_06290 [Alphaproteobacteria bacterium HGW-Alphaproteobacteria-2]